MIDIEQAVIVEGKYDKIKLSSVINAVIITTDGFGIFRDKEKTALIRYYAKKTGIIILTDSDSAGRKIRNYIKGCISDGNIINIYIPDIFGKEKRKEKPSAEGKLGVEGISAEILLDAFEKYGVKSRNNEKKRDIDDLTMYELCLSGHENSRSLRKKLQKELGLPELMSTSSLIEVLNTMMDKEELEERVKSLKSK